MAEEQQYNVRIIKREDGTFVYDPTFPMLRLANRKNTLKRLRRIEPERVLEWVDASKSDRDKLAAALVKGQLKEEGFVVSEETDAHPFKHWKE